MYDWSPISWQSKSALQQPTYPDPRAVEGVVDQLALLPPLVTSWEIENLREQLASAARGDSFLLQGGDCSESFSDCRPDIITNKLKILLQMSLVLTYSLSSRVIRVGRIAGQFAKPRSRDLETIDGQTLASYRGDLINRSAFTEQDRVPDPQLMLRGYERAALTLNFIRGLIDGGFADLHHPEYWNLAFVEHSERSDDYQHMVEAIGEGLRFMETLAGNEVAAMGRVDFFTSHEGLHLLYEQAQTRRVPRRNGWYNLSTHLPWIGMRTADPGGAHVEFFRGLANPVAVKIGQAMGAEQLLELMEILDPDQIPGRLTLIHRFGAGKVVENLPQLIETVAAAGRQPLWVCDPMHGNTRSTDTGIKTRRFEDIVSEIEDSLEVHHRLDSHLGGVHLELTGEDVTECTGGARGLADSDLDLAYHTQVDPRLNYEQALEVAMLIGRASNLLD